MKKQCHLIRALAKGGLDQLHLIIEWIEGMTPDKTWSCLFTNPIFDNLVEQTQFYAIRDKENHNFYQIISKAYQFIGIFLLYGFCKVAKEKHYWSSQTGLHVLLMSWPGTNTLLIKQCLHVADNRNLVEGSRNSEN